ncbi:MAG TPA: helix-turn-helix transcriptional regulator [Solirubrobacterales bacterium]|nr:helix-turn-helix transcriptional regulator [Solirubrobacterales bacterium]
MTDRIELDPIAPIGTREAAGFVYYSDGSGEFRAWSEPTYPPHPEGERFRAARVAAGVSLRAAAKLLGLRPVDVSNLEQGRVVPRGGWAALHERMKGDR